MTDEDLNTRFTYHSPKPGQPELYTRLRDLAHALADEFNASQPDSREKSTAISKLEEAVMWANAGIARNGR